MIYLGLSETGALCFCDFIKGETGITVCKDGYFLLICKKGNLWFLNDVEANSLHIGISPFYSVVFLCRQSSRGG